MAERRKALRQRVEERIAKRGDAAFLTREFRDLGDERQVLRALRSLTKEGKLIRLGYGVYGSACRCGAAAGTAAPRCRLRALSPPDSRAAVPPSADGWLPPPLGAFQHRRLAGLHDVLRAAHGGGRVGGHHLADHQPVEQHPPGGELLLHARRRVGLLQCLDIGADIVRPDRGQRQAATVALG